MIFQQWFVCDLNLNPFLSHIDVKLRNSQSKSQTTSCCIAALHFYDNCTARRNWLSRAYNTSAYRQWHCHSNCTSDGTTSYLTMKSCIVPACSTSRTWFTSKDWVSLGTSPDFVPMYQQTRSYKSAPSRSMVSGLPGVETRLWPTVDHLDPPDLPRHGCNSDRGPAASGGPTVLANDRNGGRLRLNALRHDDDETW